jgi:hypothetical protein
MGRNDGTFEDGSEQVSSGYFGKAASFDGSNDYVSVSNFANPANITVSTWVSFSDTGWSWIANKRDTGDDQWQVYYYVGYLGAQIFDGTTDVGTADYLFTPTLNAWYHVAFTVEGVNNGDVILYLNGNNVASDTLTDDMKLGSRDMIMGAAGWGTSGSLNLYGKIDDVMIFNRTLSGEEIAALYANQTTKYLETNFTNLASGNYTFKAYTQDRAGNVNSTETREVKAGNTAPNQPTLISPNGTTLERYTNFNWSCTDPNGDSLTYYLNITCFGGGGCSSDNRFITGITDSNYTLQAPLKNFWDDTYYYNWSVLATDGTLNSTWSETLNASLSSVVSLSISQSELYFGTMNPGDTDNTSNDDPVPFNLTNDGNCMNDVNITATSLWTTAASPTDYYRFKADNTSSIATNLNVNWSNSTTGWSQMPTASTKFLDYFNWSNATVTADTIEFDVAVEVPMDESSGNKSSTITITGMYVTEA